MYTHDNVFNVYIHNTDDYRLKYWPIRKLFVILSVGKAACNSANIRNVTYAFPFYCFFLPFW